MITIQIDDKTYKNTFDESSLASLIKQLIDLWYLKEEKPLITDNWDGTFNLPAGSGHVEDISDVVKPLSQKRAEAIERGNKEMENKPLPYGSCGCEWILHPFWVLCVNCNAGRSIHATIQGESKMITEEERDDLLKMWWDFVWENKPRQPQEDIELPEFNYENISNECMAQESELYNALLLTVDKMWKQVELLTSTVNQLIQANNK